MKESLSPMMALKGSCLGLRLACARVFFTAESDGNLRLLACGQTCTLVFYFARRHHALVHKSRECPPTRTSPAVLVGKRAALRTYSFDGEELVRLEMRQRHLPPVRAHASHGGCSCASVQGRAGEPFASCPPAAVTRRRAFRRRAKQHRQWILPSTPPRHNISMLNARMCS